MTNYALKIRESNKQAHIDIEKDIQERRNGLFTFTLRVDGGNIVDYNVTEHIELRERFLALSSITVSQLTTAYCTGTDGSGSTVLSDHGVCDD